MRRETRFTAVQPQTWKRVYDRDNHRCVLCGRRGILQAAHFIEQIRTELREYLQGLYPDWDENELKYHKEMER